MEFRKICVLGLGYIGLPTASTLATHGLQVIGVDVNPQVVHTLRNGGLHIHEPGLRTLVQAALQSGNLKISDQLENADAFIIAVPTPFKEGKKADLYYVISAGESIVPYLSRGNLVVLESTSPPHTTEDILAPILEQSGLKAGIDFHLVYSPERVLPGQILRELIENDRVMGGINYASAQAGLDLYKTFVRGEIFLTNPTTAEMVKLMENTYRDINIAIANEFSRLSDHVGIDVWEAISLANRHPRINILRPGPGVGGHCVGVDPWFLVEVASELTPLIRTAREVNDFQPQFVINLIQRALGNIAGRHIGVLGLAYKPDVDDLRESPAVEVIHRLVEAGAQIKAFDPFKSDVQIDEISSTQTLEDAIKDAEALVLLVLHTPFKHLDPKTVASMTKARVIVDAVNGLSHEIWEADGFRVYRLGVGF